MRLQFTRAPASFMWPRTDRNETSLRSLKLFCSHTRIYLIITGRRGDDCRCGAAEDYRRRRRFSGTVRLRKKEKK